MSCFLLYLGTDRRFDKLLHHTLLVGDGYKRFIRDVTRGGRLPSTYSTYLHLPTRTEPEMAPPGGESLCALLPVPNLRGERVDGDRLRDALLEDFASSFGLEVRDAIAVEHRMTPEDFERELG